MCINFRPPEPDMLKAVVDVVVGIHEGSYKPEIWKDYWAPIIRPQAEGGREAILATYGMVPHRHIPPHVKRFDTMNARAETVGQLHSYSRAWRHSQLCLVPMTAWFEPSWETGKAVRWAIGRPDHGLFAVAGLWREWSEPDGTIAASFTQITINADDHGLMRRFHKPGDEKRSLVVVPEQEWDAWLQCRDPELARSLLRPFPAELMTSWAEPLAPRKAAAPATTAVPVPQSLNGDLFAD